jgi:hypothetical protein
MQLVAARAAAAMANTGADGMADGEVVPHQWW